MKPRTWFLIPNVCVLLSMATVSAAEPPVRILPLGDSMTSGVPVEGGYRSRLYSVLSSDGFTVDFLGTQTVNSNHPQLPDADHEGHGGFQIHEIDAGLEGWLSSVEDPDVVLLWIGTNDYSVSNDINNARNRLANLIGRIATLRPHAKIIVANLLLRTDIPTADQNIQTTFNPFLPAMVDQQVQLGRQVSFVDMRSQITAADLVDGLHPGSPGYNKIADTWRSAIQAVITPAGTTNRPAIVRVKGHVNRRNVSLTFSKPVEDAAAAAGNFALSGGVSVLAAELDVPTKRTITLTTTPQAQDTVYTVTVNGVRDRTPARNAIAANAQASFGSGNIAEAVNFDLVYSLPVPRQSDFNINGVPYQVDKHVGLGAFNRVAYYLELESAAGRQYAWVSMDAFTTDAARIGIPALQTGAFFQQPAVNMNVQSTVAGVANGTGFSGGRLEFWPGNYGTANAAGVSGASDVTYDFGDSAAPGEAGYGSMQIHNGAASQTVLAFNGWGGGGWVNDVGIGNASGQHPDWTFAQNATAYTNRVLQVYVRLGGGSPGAPVITTQPEGLTVNPGGSASFTVAATGSGTLSYQWRFNGTPISGATAATHTINNVQSQHAGSYDVVVANASGSVTSSAAVLTVPLTGLIANGSFESGFSGWSAGGNVSVVQGNVYAPFDGTSVLAFNSGQNPPNGVVSQMFATTPGTEYSLTFAAGVLAFNTSEQRIQVTLQGATTLQSRSISMIGDASGKVKWSSYTYLFTADSTLTRVTFRDVSPTSLNLDATLDKVQITAQNAPVITAQPVNQAVLAGASASFSVTATGQAPLSYQWRFNGSPIPGATSSTLNLANAQTGAAGNYDVVVSNTAGSVGSSVAVLTVLEAGVFANGSFESGFSGWTVSGNASLISGLATDGQAAVAFNTGQQPPNAILSQTVASAPGQNGTLAFDFGVWAYNSSEQRIRVTVQGAGILVQQTVSIFGVGNGAVTWISRSYPFVSDSGALTIRFEDVSPTSLNLDGLLDNVRLTLQGNPVIVTQPSSQTVTVGGTASFSVTATGAAPLAYQWRRNGSPIGGATASTFTINNVQTSHAGDYTVVVSNGAGPVTSSAATLVVTTSGGGLVNGSFESNFDGWTASGNAAVSTGTFYRPTDGNSLAVFNSGQTTPNGAISQTIPTAPGQSHTLSFDFGVLAYNFNEQRIRVTVQGVGTLVNQTIVNSGSGNGVTQWISRSFAFIADGNSITVTFQDVSSSTSNLDAVLDKVALATQSAPTITTQPLSQAVAVGQSVTFSVTAAGQLPLAYQWRFNGAAISGANSNQHTISAVQAGNSGNYDVVVSNGSGSVTSSVAVLTVAEPVAFKNGSFESGLADWTVSGNVQASTGTFYAPTDGQRTAVFNAGQSTPNGVVSQTVTTTPGQAYTVSFDAGVLAYNASAQLLRVTVQGNSTLVDSTLSFSGDGTGTTKWTSRSFSFTADSPSVVLTFRDLSPATLNLDLTLDRVQLVPQGGGAGLLAFAVSDGRGGQGLDKKAGAASITWSPTGWTITGFASRRGIYRLERSEDLDSWTALGEISAAVGGILEFQDQDAPGLRAFYRIVPVDNGQASE